MDKHLNAIENVALGVVGVECLVARYLRIGMVRLHQVVIDDDREGAAHNSIVDNNNNLSLREDGYEFLDLSLGPKHILISVDALERTGKLIVVLHLKVAQLHFVDVVSFHRYSE